MPIGVVYNPIYLEHDTGRHPETSLRLEWILRHLKKSSVYRELRFFPSQKANESQVGWVHSPDYIKCVQKLSSSGGGFLDEETPVSPRTYEVALWAVGGCFTGIDIIMKEEVKRAFALVRPPGHHAEPHLGMGFCIFNNIALAARYVQNKYNVNRIVIIDWDLHHGNGTQSIFYNDARVLYVSIHCFPCYPGTGSFYEKGEGLGEGTTINFPVPPGSGFDVFQNCFGSTLYDRLKEFCPEIFLVSAGFDAYSGDPLGGLVLEADDFRKLTVFIKDLADRFCKGRILSVLEGGYSREGLGPCVEAHLKGMLAG